MFVKLMKINFVNIEMQILDNLYLFIYIYINCKLIEWWYKGSNLYVYILIFFVYLIVCVIVYGLYFFY